MKFGIRASVVAISLLFQSGCSTLEFGPRPPAIPSAKDIHDFRNDEVKNTDGLTAAEFTAAGYNKTYKACTDYFDSLILVQNQTAFAGDQMAAAGTAAATILGLAEQPAATIGEVAAGVGFVSSTIASFKNHALMTPYPDETKSLILAALDQFSSNAPASSVTSLDNAIGLVEHYAEICTYSGISRFAKQALTKAQPVAQAGSASILTDPDKPDSQAIATDLGVQSFSDTELAFLYVYLFGTAPDGTPVWKNSTEATAILKQFSSSIWTQMTADGTPTGTVKDPATLTSYSDISTRLKNIYARNANFRSLVTSSEARFNGTGTLSPAGQLAGKALVQSFSTVEVPAPFIVVK